MKLTIAIPDTHIQHLNDGEKLILTATPFDPSFNPVSLAFDLKHIYEVKMLPGQPWINGSPIFHISKNTTAEQLIAQVMKALMIMAHITGGASFSVDLIERNTTVSN